jgi:hypothetical protein
MDYANIIGIGDGVPVVWVVLGAFIAFGIMLRCEWLDEFSRHLRNGVFHNIGFPQVRKNVCPICGYHISDYELQPHDGALTSRSVHAGCFERFFTQKHSNCVICGRDISHKVGSQTANWREIKNHICDQTECQAWWSAIHAGVHGITQQAIASEQEIALPDIGEIPSLYDEGSQDFIDADFEEVRPKAIGYQKQPTVEDMVNQARLKSLGRSANFQKASIRRRW